MYIHTYVYIRCVLISPLSCKHMGKNKKYFFSKEARQGSPLVDSLKKYSLRYICTYVSYVCVCVCMYVCIYIRMNVCIYVCMYIYTYVYIRMYVYTHIRMYVYVHIHTYVCMYIRMHVYTYVYTYVCIHTYVCMYVFNMPGLCGGVLPLGFL
jgi:hypothetical protein